MNEYETKQELKKQRLEDRAATARREAADHDTSARRMADQIPMGQPILVGHHSEGRHRRHLERIRNKHDKSMEAHKKAERLERRAEGVGRGGISQDDPDALVKLNQRVDDLRARDELAKVVSRAMRKGRREAGGKGTKDDRDPAVIDAGIEAGLAVEGADVFRSHLEASRNAFPWPPELGSKATEIRRLRKRIADLEEKAGDKTTERDGGHGLTITDNVEDNRLQLDFPGKPPDEVRALLKSNGFRWARSLGVWQRHRGGPANAAADRVASVWAEVNRG